MREFWQKPDHDTLYELEIISQRSHRHGETPRIGHHSARGSDQGSENSMAFGSQRSGSKGSKQGDGEDGDATETETVLSSELT